MDIRNATISEIEGQVVLIDEKEVRRVIKATDAKLFVFANPHQVPEDKTLEAWSRKTLLPIGCKKGAKKSIRIISIQEATRLLANKT